MRKTLGTEVGALPMGRRKTVATAIVVALISLVAVFGFYALRARAESQRRIALARETAILVVTSAEGGNPVDLERAFGRPVSALEANRMQALFSPRVRAASPSDFTAPFWNPVGSEGSTVEVQHPADPNFAVVVALNWDSGQGRWRPLGTVLAKPK